MSATISSALIRDKASLLRDAVMRTETREQLAERVEHIAGSLERIVSNAVESGDCQCGAHLPQCPLYVEGTLPLAGPRTLS